jgi:hypothetical protein
VRPTIIKVEHFCEPGSIIISDVWILDAQEKERRFTRRAKIHGNFNEAVAEVEKMLTPFFISSLIEGGRQ